MKRKKNDDNKWSEFSWATLFYLSFLLMVSSQKYQQVPSKGLIKKAKSKICKKNMTERKK